MLKMRLGAVPDTEVKIPQPPVQSVPSVRRSSQCGEMAGPCAAYGRQTLVNVESVAVNSRLPLESTFAELYEVPYRLKANGKAILVVPSSVWLPVSTVPGTIVPVAVA